MYLNYNWMMWYKLIFNGKNEIRIIKPLKPIFREAWNSEETACKFIIIIIVYIATCIYIQLQGI